MIQSDPQSNNLSPTYPNQRVVFLLGIMPRSGTNFLAELLCRHPDCGATFHITEDFLLANAHHLETFVNSVHHSWSLLWGEYDASLKEPLLRALGHGLEQYLYEQTEADWLEAHRGSDTWPDTVKVRPKVRIARTPSVENLELFTRLTDAKAIVIIRDGRSVVESGMRSFGWWFEDALQRWASEAKRIIDVANSSPQIYCVRYEDLLDDRPGELHKLFNFISVDPNLYDYEAEVPVRGSSTFFNKQQGINWHDTKPDESFDPRQRWQHWSRSRRARFSWVAAKEMRGLGYQLEDELNGFWRIYNIYIDTIWPLRKWVRALGRKIVPQSIRDRVMWNRGKLYRMLLRKDGTEVQPTA